ncbi:MAG: hypothetical protein ACRDHP_04540 [Ktedonobacterales bacterium]
MLDSTASHNLPDPSPRPSGLTTRVVLDSAPRQEALPMHHELMPDHPLSPPWPPSLDYSGGTATAPREMPAMEDAGSMDSAHNGDDGDDDDEGEIEGDFAPRHPDDRATRPLFAPEQWVSDPDFWESKTHIALTGRRPVPRPKTVALKPPQRFRPAPRWRSMLVLLVVCLLIAFTLVGIVEIARLGTQALAPTHHTATPVPTHTLTVPTATPHHKK